MAVRSEEPHPLSSPTLRAPRLLLVSMAGCARANCLELGGLNVLEAVTLHLGRHS